MSATPADPTIPAPATKCIKCQNETTTTADLSDAANFCTDCLSLKTEKRHNTTQAITEAEAEQPQTVKMKIFADLTTTETLDEFDDELNDNKPAINGNGVLENHKDDDEQQQQHKETDTETPSPKAAGSKSPSPATVKAEPAALIERAETKMASRSAPAPPPPPPQTKPAAAPVPAPTPPQRGGGKVTRSSLNGNRSPTIVKRLRKSTRSTRFKATKTANNALNGHTLGQSGAAQAGASAASAQGKAQSKSERGSGGAGAATNAKNRRTLFKRPAQKTPRVQASTRFVQSVFYKDSYIQIGDIVSIVDSEQNLYYAQVRGLLVDAYCEKSAFLTWLIPTQDSPDPKDGFDPATYLIGPDEELSRKLGFLEFVMHAPSNYYYDRTTPFPLPDVDEYTAHRSGGYIWTRLPTLKRERERERDKKAAA